VVASNVVAEHRCHGSEGCGVVGIDVVHGEHDAHGRGDGIASTTVARRMRRGEIRLMNAMGLAAD
jgi:hypothetical protein